MRRFKQGDEVYARPPDGRIGAFAEFIAIREDDVAIKLTALSMEEAASIPLVGLTAWQALIERAHLKHGQKVLIHAGSGGVGTFGIQLAKHVGGDGGDDHEYGQCGSGSKPRGRHRDVTRSRTSPTSSETTTWF